MPALAHRFQEPTFRESITSYVAVTCHRYRVRRVEVEDVVQEALTKIVTCIATFRPEKGEFDAWARGVALNVIRQHSRAAKRYSARFSEYHPNMDEHAAPEPSPEWCARRKQARCAIANAAENLPSRQVEVLVLHVVDDMSHGDIADELNISEAASQKCYQRARNHLALCISDEAFSVMPPFVTGCDESVSFNENGSRWTERSHYAGQIVATILAFLAFIPSSQTPQMRASMTGEIRVLGPIQNAVMSRSDERAAVHDQPFVFRDAPSVKPELASTPSVHNVATPAKVGDKPTYVEDLAPIPPFKPTESTTAHLPSGQ